MKDASIRSGVPRCAVCGRYLPYAEEFVFIEADMPMRMISLDPPEMAPAHKSCAREAVES